MNRNACLYKGTVFHRRFAPKTHYLKYKVFTLFADLDDLRNLDKNYRFFSLNRFNILSFHEKDYGNPNDNSGASLKDRLIKLLSDNGVDIKKVCRIKTLTYPRMFGFVFNPLTVFYCYGASGEHIALIYEVRNTFGERHNYIYQIPKGNSFCDEHEVDKCFHVSPFFDRSGGYQFKINDPQDHASVLIDYFGDNEKLMTANFIGKKVPFNNKTILALSFGAPFMTVKVVAGIMFEAFKLKLKGLKVFSHPENHDYQSSWATQSSKSRNKPQIISSNKQEK